MRQVRRPPVQHRSHTDRIYISKYCFCTLTFIHDAGTLYTAPYFIASWTFACSGPSVLYPHTPSLHLCLLIPASGARREVECYGAPTLLVPNLLIIERGREKIKPQDQRSKLSLPRLARLHAASAEERGCTHPCGVAEGSGCWQI